MLDTVFGLPSKDAADVLGVTPETFRQRLSRTRARLDTFTQRTCGLVAPEAACTCDKQLPAIRFIRFKDDAPTPLAAIHSAEKLEAQRNFAAFVRLCDTAALFRAHPEYQVPSAMQGAIRAVLHVEGFWDDQRPLH